MKTHPIPIRFLGVALAASFLWAGDVRAAEGGQVETLATCGTTDVTCWIGVIKKMSKDVSSLASDVIPAVKTTLNDVETGVSDIEATFTELEQAGTKVVGEFKSAIDIVEKDSGESAGQFFTFSDELVTRLTDEWAYLTSELEETSADYTAFAGTDGQCTPLCVAFRRDIGGVIRRFGQVTALGTAQLESELAASGSGSLTFTRTFDTGSWAQEIESAPPILLYPLHVALDGMAGTSAALREPAGFRGADLPSSSVRATCTGGGYCGVVNSVHEALDRIENGLSQLGQTTQGTRASATWPPPCSQHELEPSMSELAYVLFVYGAIQTTLSVPLQSAGLGGFDTAISPGADVGASAEVAFKARPLRQIAHALKMVGDPPLTLGDLLLGRIGECRNRLNAQFLLCNLIQGGDCQTRVLGGEVFGF